MTHAIDHDDLWPRDEEHRYRIYAVTDDSMDVLAATSTAGGVGVALVTLHEDEKKIGRRLADRGFIGVLDVLEHEWIVLPFTRRSAA